ncbi:MAG: HIT family protein [Actinobacteria bacterium]|nr:HIT family protein [Actinomycetota bacterium]
MPCVFCDIVAGESPAHVVLDDDTTVAFLDIRPLFHGHTLVVPREHVVTLPELDGNLVGPFFERVQRLSIAVKEGCGAQGTLIAINNTVSQSVAHLHAHVVPRTKGDGLRGFFWPRHPYDGPEHAEEVAGRIRAALP